MEGSIDQPRYEDFRDNPNPLEPAEGDAYIGQADYEALVASAPSHTFETEETGLTYAQMRAIADDPNDPRIQVEGDGEWLGPEPTVSTSRGSGFDSLPMRDGELANYRNVSGVEVRVHWSSLNVRNDSNEPYPSRLREGDTAILSGVRERRRIGNVWYTMYELEGGNRWIAGSGIEPVGDMPEQPGIETSDEWLTSPPTLEQQAEAAEGDFENLDSRTQNLVENGMEYLRAREPRLNFILEEYGDSSIEDTDEQLYQAIRSFQESRNITVDGIIGPVTKEHIREAFREYLS